jgi:hypothetical protein
MADRYRSGVRLSWRNGGPPYGPKVFRRKGQGVGFQALAAPRDSFFGTETLVSSPKKELGRRAIRSQSAVRLDIIHSSSTAPRTLRKPLSSTIAE